MQELVSGSWSKAIATVFAIIRESAAAKTDPNKAHEAWATLKECVRALPRLLRQPGLLVCGGRRATAAKRREMRHAQPRTGLPATLASLVCSAMRRFGAPVRLAGVEALQNMTAYTDIAHRDVGAAIIPEVHAALLAALGAEHPHPYSHERVLVAQSALATLWNVALLDERTRECTCASHVDGELCGGGACVRAIVDAGVLPCVVAALRTFPTAAKLLFYGCGVLSAAATCADPRRRAAVFDADSVRAVVEVVQRPDECADDPPMWLTCLGVLHDLLAPQSSSTVETRGAAVIRTAGGIAVLLRALCSATSTRRLLTLASIALWNACLDDEGCRALVATRRTVRALARTALQCHDTDTVVASSIGLLYTICIQSDELCAAVRDKYVVDCILFAALQRAQRKNDEIRRNLCTLVAVLFHDCDADAGVSKHVAALWHYACATFMKRKMKDAALRFMLLAAACAAMRALGKSGMPLFRKGCETAPSQLRMVPRIFVAMEECGEGEGFARLQCEATVDALLGRRNTPAILEADTAIRKGVFAG